MLARILPRVPFSLREKVAEGRMRGLPLSCRAVADSNTAGATLPQKPTMHPLRVLLLVSVVIAVAVAWAFGAALHHGGAELPAVAVLSLVAFVAFMIPWTGVFLWAYRRARDHALLPRSHSE